MEPKPSKPFLTYEQQLYNLIENKNLTVCNTEYAISKLQDIGYYSLIDGYKDLFYNSMTRIYIHGTCFEDIVALYKFDENLRSLIFQYICQIEQKLRSQISYVFCETHSVNQDSYLTPTNYCYSPKTKNHIDNLLKILYFEANMNMEHAYVIHQRNTYKNVPLWVIMNTLTMGQTSKMYSFLNSSMKSRISKQYKNVSEKELSQFLKLLTHYRNLCAHNERLFSFKSRYAIPDTILHKKMNIPQLGKQYILGKHDLFAVIISFRYLLPREDFLIFKKKLNQLIKNFSQKTDSYKKDKLLSAMGLPKNWTNISKYKL